MRSKHLTLLLSLFFPPPPPRHHSPRPPPTLLHHGAHRQPHHRPVRRGRHADGAAQGEGEFGQGGGGGKRCRPPPFPLACLRASLPCGRRARADGTAGDKRACREKVQRRQKRRFFQPPPCSPPAPPSFFLQTASKETLDFLQTLRKVSGDKETERERGSAADKTQRRQNWAHARVGVAPARSRPPLPPSPPTPAARQSGHCGRVRLGQDLRAAGREQ